MFLKGDGILGVERGGDGTNTVTIYRHRLPLK